MKRASGIIIFILLFVAACAAAFFVGYSPMHVPQDKVGVLVSKTSGVSEKPIEAGKFQWNWQLLLPTNAEIRTFSAKPFTYKQVKNGELPGAEVYSAMFAEKPSFKYSFNFSFELKCKPEVFVQFVKDSDIENDSELKTKYELVSEEIVSKIMDKVLAQFNEVSDKKFVDFEEIKSEIISEYENLEFSIASLNITDIKLPDADIYKTAKDMYKKHMSDIAVELEKLTSLQAKEISDNTKNLSKLEKFGKVIKENPELAELLKSSKDLSETLKTIYSND